MTNKRAFLRIDVEAAEEAKQEHVQRQREEGDEEKEKEEEADLDEVGRALQGDESMLYQRFYPQMMNDLQSRVWMTYRMGFPPLAGAFCTDAGWGCMHRSAQMVLSEALIRLHLGEDWRVDPDQQPPVYRRILKWFADDPKAPFGIHKIAMWGQEHAGKPVGSWYEPGTAGHALQYLCNEFPQAGVRVHVATDGIVYKEEVEAVAWADEQEGKVWKPVLLMVVVRLGVEKINLLYSAALRAVFQCPSTLGIAGGRPRSSLYSFACQGEDVFYLDPHFSRDVVSMAEPDFSTETYSCNVVRKMHVADMDPSMAFAFLFRTEEEWDTFCVTLDHPTTSPSASMEDSKRAVSTAEPRLLSSDQPDMEAWRTHAPFGLADRRPDFSELDEWEASRMGEGEKSDSDGFELL